MQCSLVNTDVSEEPDISISRTEHILSATHTLKAQVGPESSFNWQLTTRPIILCCYIYVYWQHRLFPRYIYV